MDSIVTARARAARTPKTPKTRSSRPPKLPLRPERILIAEDEHLIALGLGDQLRELGYRVVGPATDGHQAVELCAKHKPDLALLDIRMPRCDGLTAALAITKQHGVPVIMLTALADQGHVNTATQQGVFGYLLKPVTLDQLRIGIELAWSRFMEESAQRGKIDELTTRLEGRRLVEQAKWVLVQHKGITEPDANRLIQEVARKTRRSMTDLARQIIENQGQINEE